MCPEVLELTEQNFNQSLTKSFGCIKVGEPGIKAGLEASSRCSD